MSHLFGQLDWGAEGGEGRGGEGRGGEGRGGGEMVTARIGGCLYVCVCVDSQLTKNTRMRWTAWNIVMMMSLCIQTTKSNSPPHPLTPSHMQHLPKD